MVELDAVRAWHANPRVADPNRLVCPVYDTLSDSELERFSNEPFNAAGFVPRPSGLPLTEFLPRAVARLRAALRANAYARDDRPSLYVYGIRYAPPPDILETIEAKERRREYLLLGLVGCLDLSQADPGAVALHERTFEDRVEERREVADATGMNFAPIMAGYHRPDHRLNDHLERLLGLNRRALSFEGAIPPVAEATLDGTAHRLWCIQDEHDVKELKQIVRELRLLVLDGHHRFTAATLRHRAGRASAPLVILVDGQDRALRVLPWHRVLPASRLSPPKLLASVRERFEAVVKVQDAPSVEGAIATLRAMHRERRRGFLLFDGQALYEVRGPPSVDVGYDFDLLHGFLEGQMGIDPHSFRFVRSPRQAFEAAAGDKSVAGGSALLLPALSERGIEERVFGGGPVMAHKSTMFLPKVAEGMIFAPADGTG